MNKKKIAVFLDRDGTLIHEAHYLKDLKDLKLFNETAEAIKKLNDAKILAIMISNQSGVARGYFDEKNVKFINNEMNELLKKQGAGLDGFYYCPHHPKGNIESYSIDCNCRKPLTGMLDNALKNFPEINLEKSYVIGDKACDIELAHNAGCKGILVMTGHGKDTDINACNPHFIAKDIREAINWVLENCTKQ